MCLIIYSPDGSQVLDEDKFVASINRNSDAAGIMYVEEGRVKVEKMLGGDDTQALHDWCFAKQAELAENGAFAIHHRMSTDGADTEENCHPFKVLSLDDGDDRDLFMMHNGVIRKCKTSRNAVLSDTRTYVKDYLMPMLKHSPDLLEVEAFREHVGEYIGASKLLFLDSTGKFTIVNEDQGEWHVKPDDETAQGGLWLSNTYSINVVKPVVPYRGTQTNFTKNTTDDSKNVVPFDDSKKKANSQPTTPSTSSTRTGTTGYGNNSLALAEEMELWEIDNPNYIGLSPDELADTLLERGFQIHQLDDIVSSLDQYSLTLLVEELLERIYARDYS